MDNRVMYWPRGRVWGGSSSLNAMVYIRGHAEDYNRWQREGADGWGYEHCLPYFRKAQCHELGEDRWPPAPSHVRLSSSLIPAVPLIWVLLPLGTVEGAGLLMCPEERPTILFTRLLFRRVSRPATPLLMTWMGFNRRVWAGWIWPLIKVWLQSSGLKV